jgi:nitroimidazol reductase NimA-like FMN-containing flavoprotein (pyridoxamine 5'-phosphate oxidase superfamily)
MADQRTSLSESETDSILRRHETGVLSLARENEPYSVPISYGYDAEHRRFYLRLVSTPESKKRLFLSSSSLARFVVYEEDAPIYRSIITVGTLTEIPRDDLTSEHIEQYGQGKRPLFEIWEETRSDLDVRLYRLMPESISGRELEIDRADVPSEWGVS